MHVMVQGAVDQSVNIVDAHPHIYSSDKSRYPTIDDPWEPGEPAEVADLKARMDDSGVSRAVFIQTGTYYGWDNRYVMTSTRANSDWATGVVTLNPEDPAHLDVLTDAAENYNVRGLRGAGPGSEGAYRLWTRARDLGVVVNCMVLDDLDAVPAIEKIATDLDDLQIVIDHCFMLSASNMTQTHTLDAKIAALERLSALPNIHAKVTPGAHGSQRVYPHEDMHDPLKRVIDAFGPNRCVWGSNFPNALWSKGTSYDQNLTLFTEELGLSTSDQEAILGGTAMRLWFS
ncbi:MAG: amidohydrolase family protein [Chloroflexi bacterium]|nr:amidohydrolase family protein [Chloroflexota bacterium]